ncbi:MAG: lipid A biosynthesis acyltransferase [Gammaproteobacteria bacterium]|nr:lipid A biosynthesis acyltransferase [Gammaproteobacteria bacterium]
MCIEDSNHDRYRFRLVLLKPSNWFTWLGLGLFFIITLLPIACIDWLGGRLGDIAAHKNKKRFNIAKKNLALCFADKDDAELEQMVVEHFRAQFRSLMHYFMLWWRPRFVVKSRLHTEGFEQITQYQQQGKQVITLVAHSVGLEFAVAAITMAYSSSGPYKAMRNPVIDWMVAGGRIRFGKHFGGKLFTRDDGLKPLIRETRAGKVMIYLADEDLGERNSIFVPFFGVQKATIPVLGRLAKACNAVVLPCVSCYEPAGRRYSVKMLPAIESFPSGSDEQDAARMNNALEQLIELCPLQYLWTLRYFQTRPPGEPPVYD